MKTLLAALLFATASLAPLAAATKPNVQAERIGASFLLALGRAPSASELAEWSDNAATPFAELLSLHQQKLQADPALARATAVKAAIDAFGRAPTERELAAASGATPTYTELMKQHVAGLEANPAEYEKMIERAYRRVINRAAFSIEFDYWKARPVLPFTMLVGCVEDWGRRNAPGLMATTGTPTVSVNSNYLATVRLSPTVAAEARLATGLVARQEAALAIAAGHNLVAPGAAPVVTQGHMHFAAAGADNLVLAGN